MTEKHIIDDLLLQGLDGMLHLGWITQTVAILQGKDRDDLGNLDMQQLWWIAGTVHDVTGIPLDTPELVEPTLEAIHELIVAAYAFVGDAVQDERGFTSVEPWNLPPDAAVARIKERWNELVEPLNIGDVVWMELTEKGSQGGRKAR
jgi:hypothetical protein